MFIKLFRPNGEEVLINMDHVNKVVEVLDDDHSSWIFFSRDERLRVAHTIHEIARRLEMSADNMGMFPHEEM